MAERVDATERRARGHRLIIIFVVAFVILGGGLALRTLRNRSLDHKADSAMSELRPQWQAIDLAKLSDDYANATTAANDTGDYSKAFGLFPRTSQAEFASATFDHLGIVHAAYSIDAWGGAHECLGVLVSAPTPNRVVFQREVHGC
jgi:hypothetical protein